MRPIEVKRRERKLQFKKEREEKKKRKKNIKSKYKVLMLKSSHKKGRKNNNKITKSIFHHLCPGLPVSLTFRLVR